MTKERIFIEAEAKKLGYESLTAMIEGSFFRDDVEMVNESLCQILIGYNEQNKPKILEMLWQFARSPKHLMLIQAVTKFIFEHPTFMENNPTESNIRYYEEQIKGFMKR
jgi:hypothetical protein